MARKPKVIETPGDNTPEQYESLARPEGKARPQPQAATPAGDGEILDRMGRYVLRRGYGWCEE